ncbi:MAG: hypothetical protein ABIG68_09815, partial [Acidobacteriota bacterium]
AEGLRLKPKPKRKPELKGQKMAIETEQRHTLGSWQVGHVHQDWTEIWGPDAPDGSHEILGSFIGPAQIANADFCVRACNAYHDMLEALIIAELAIRQAESEALHVVRAAIAKATT